MERPADFTIFRISDFTRQEYSWCFFSDFLCFERKGENTLDKTARIGEGRNYPHHSGALRLLGYISK